MLNLIEEMIEQGILKAPAIIQAFEKIKREDFMVEAAHDKASVNEPFSIGYGQTNSQPSTVALMMELLEPRAGETILDVGSGSGWTTALLAELVGETGKVYGIEIIEELKDFGEENVKKYGFIDSDRVKMFCGDGSKGLKDFAPYDAIHVGAGAMEIPEALKEQLKVGGRMVIPVGVGSQEMVLIKKISEKNYEEKRFPGFQFVPLVVQ